MNPPKPIYGILEYDAQLPELTSLVINSFALGG